MKSSLKQFINTAFLVLFFTFFTAFETPAQLQEILNRMDTHQKSLTSLRMKVKMEKANFQLQETDLMEGTAIYWKMENDKLTSRVDWTKPVQESTAMRDKKFIVYRPRLKQAFVGKFDDVKGGVLTVNQLSFLSMSKKDLKAYYSINYIGAEKLSNGVEVVQLVLNPKSNSPYKAAAIWIDRNGMPNQIKIVDLSNDHTTVLFSDFTKNELIKPSEIRITLPSGTKVIKDNYEPCLCFKPDTVKEAFKDDADVVFSGRITGIKDKIYTFQTERVWKGEVGKSVSVQSFENYFDCPLNPIKGNRYIVFANKKSDKGVASLALMPCNYTTDLSTEKGVKILKEIGNGKAVNKLRIVKKRRVEKINKNKGKSNRQYSRFQLLRKNMMDVGELKLLTGRLKTPLVSVKKELEISNL